LDTLFNTLSLLCILTTTLSVLNYRKWWCKVWDISRVNIAGLALVSLLLCFFIEDIYNSKTIALMAINSVCLIYHLYIIRFFFAFYPKEIPDTSNGSSLISLVTINVRKKNKKYNNLVSLVKEQQPDLLLLTEVDHEWIENILPRLDEFPYRILQPQENTYGMALFSKYELMDSEIKFLVEQDIPCISTNIQFQGGKIQFIGLHPKPPAPWNKVVNKDLEILKVASMSNYNAYPSIVSGDLNDVGWSTITKQFKSISGLLDPRIGRGLYNTYNALYPVFRVPIDHVFVSEHFKIYSIKKLKKIGSDHFPVLLKVNIEK